MNDAAPEVSAPREPPIHELQARAVLARVFREAGLRIVYDVEVSLAGESFTIDGFDPKQRLGYEYVDPSEVPSKYIGRVSIEGGAVVFIPPGGADSIARLAQQFVASQRADEPSGELHVR